MAHITQQQIEEAEAAILADAAAGIGSSTVAGQSVTLMPTKDRLDVLERVTPVNPILAIGRVKTIPPSPG